MKKTIWIVAGVLITALLGGLILLNERSKVIESSTPVSQASRLPLDAQGRQDAGGTVQRLQSASATGGQAGSAAPQLSNPVKALLGLDGKERNYSELLAEIYKLGDNLSAADVTALCELLTWPNDRFPEKMRPIEVNAVKNDVLDQLLRQQELSPGLGIQIAEMAGNPENDSVWRDYCVQFMQPFYERCSTEDGRQRSEDRDQTAESAKTAQEKELQTVQEAMFSALNERSETIAGTALIGLELLSRDHEEFDREQIIEKSMEIASDWNVSPSCRLTALRMSSDLATKERKEHKNSDGEPETQNSELETDAVADTARVLAQTGDTVLLRSAAIVTLGETGSEEDRELLESFTFSENKQIVSAAQLALQKIDAKVKL